MLHDMLTALAADIEIENAVLAFHLDELASHRARARTILARVDELRAIIAASQAGLQGPATRSKLALIRQRQEVVEAAVAELDQIGDEFEAIQDAADALMAEQALRAAFRPEIGLS